MPYPRRYGGNNVVKEYTPQYTQVMVDRTATVLPDHFIRYGYSGRSWVGIHPGTYTVPDDCILACTTPSGHFIPTHDPPNMAPPRLY